MGEQLGCWCSALHEGGQDPRGHLIRAKKGYPWNHGQDQARQEDGPTSSFLPGNCLFSLTWPSIEPLEKQAYGHQGQNRPLQRASWEGRTGTVLQSYRLPLKRSITREHQGRASWDPGMEDPDMTQPSSQHPHSVSKSAWQLSNYSPA